MIWVKSFFCGVLGILIVLILSVFLIPFTLKLKTGELVAWDPISVLKHSMTWVILAAAFALGFALEYRHASP